MAYQSTWFNVPDAYSKDLMQWDHTDRNGDDVSESWGPRGPRAGVARYDPETKDMQDIQNPDWLHPAMRSLVQGAHLAGMNPDNFAWEKVVPGVNYDEAVAAKDPRVQQYWDMIGSAVQKFEPLMNSNPIAHNDGLAGLRDPLKFVGAVAGLSGLAGGLNGLIGGTGLGGASTGLSEFGTLASDAGFVPGSFDLGIGSGLDAATLGTGLGAAGNAGGNMTLDEILAGFDPTVTDNTGFDWFNGGGGTADGYIPSPTSTGPLGETFDLGGELLSEGLTAPTGSVYQQLVDAGVPWDTVSKLSSLGLSPSTLANFAKQILGAGGSGGLSGLLGGSGSGSNLLNMGLSALGSYGAYNYANNLPQPNITGYQDLMTKAGDLSGILGEYDLQTGIGRNNLNSSLNSRGVSGSSFGDQALTNYDTQRGMGRGALGYQGIGTQASLLDSSNKMTLANNAIKSDLVGRGLSGIAGAAKPASFDLMKLLGITP